MTNFQNLIKFLDSQPTEIQQLRHLQDLLQTRIVADVHDAAAWLQVTTSQAQVLLERLMVMDVVEAVPMTRKSINCTVLYKLRAM